MSKITMTIDSADIDKQVMEMLEGKIKHILRNDKIIGDAIDKVFKQEIGKRITKAMTQYSPVVMMQMEFGKLFPSRQSIAQSTLNEIKFEVKDMLYGDSNEKTIKNLFKNELEELRKVKKRR